MGDLKLCLWGGVDSQQQIIDPSIQWPKGHGAIDSQSSTVTECRTFSPSRKVHKGWHLQLTPVPCSVPGWTFWKHCLWEYLPLLQLVQKWNEPMQNLTPGDIVLFLCETVPKKTWSLGCIIRTFPGRDGLVRSTEVNTKWSVLTRPVTKLCLHKTISQ